MKNCRGWEAKSDEKMETGELTKTEHMESEFEPTTLSSCRSGVCFLYVCLCLFVSLFVLSSLVKHVI